MPKLRHFLLWLSLFLIVFGSRMIVCNHYAVDVPFSDDWEIAKDIAENRNAPVVGPVLFKTHVQHIIAFTRLEQFITAKYNGIWQMRVQNVFHSFAFSLLALTTALVINRALQNKSLSVYAAALVTFAIPWAGDRTLWSLLSSFSWMMLWMVVETAVLAFVERRYLRLVLSLFVSSLAAVSMGAGSLTLLLAAGWTGWLLIRGERRDRTLNAISLILHLSLFIFFYSLVPKSGGGMASDLITTIKAFFRCLAFPTINVWLVGLISFLPWIALAFDFVRRKSQPSKGETLLLLLGGIVILQSAGIAVFRGENNNGGIPASRYYDILILGPIINLAIILHYLDRLPRKITFSSLAVFSWMSMTLAGYLLLLFWRVTPWLSLDSGEWEQGLKQASLASWVRGEIPVLPDYVDKSAPEISYHKDPDTIIRKYVSLSNDPSSFVPGAMIAGYALTPTENSDGFQLDGFPNNRNPRPWLRYWGSHDRSGTSDRSRHFESKPLEITSSYVQFEFLLDKKSRFRFYNLGKSSLKLIRVSDNSEIDILMRLSRTFPSILGDRESVCLKLPSPGTYKIVAEDNELDTGWFAFSEPTASGPLAAVSQSILNSGKLLMFFGIILLFAAAFLKRLEPDSEVVA